MTSKQETIDLVETRPDSVIRQKAIESAVLTSEVSEYGGPVAVDIFYDYGGLRVSGFGGPGAHGWVVLAPGVSEAATTEKPKIPVELLRKA